MTDMVHHPVYDQDTDNHNNHDDDQQPQPSQSAEPAEPVESVESVETSYEVPLDEPPDPAQRRAPVYVDATVREHEVRPVVPANWRTWAGIRTTIRRRVGHAVHAAEYHALRTPKYAILASFWALIGAGRLLWKFWRWAYDMEQWRERINAADRDDTTAYMALIREADQHRRRRLPVFFGTLAGLGLVVLVLRFTAPWWVWLLLAVVVVPILAHAGRPIDKPILTPAIVAPRFRVINADVVLRAYYAARLGDPDKPGQQIQFGSPMSRDGEGSRVVVDLPYGKGFGDAIKAREAIASGLDVANSQVFLTRDPTSNRRHVLWVADRDPLAVPAGRTPLLRLRPTDIWKPAPFGLSERGDRVELAMMWNSILIGAQPRQGKTFSARSLALYAALDPHVRLTVFDGKGSPDWRSFSLVADRYGFGLAMSREGDPVEAFIDTLRAIKTDVQDRYQRLSELPRDVCPEGKLTRELARDRRFRMPVHLVVIDEFQEYFDLGDASKEIAGLLVYLVKVAPAAGVIVLGATQRPTSAGSGQVSQQFTSFRDNFQVRFSLRTGSYQVSDLVLGAGAYSEGHDSSTLLPTYKGVGILRGADDNTPTVRTYLADGQDAERILTAARGLREKAGTLTGMAAGESTARPARDPLADVIRVWATIDRPAIHWHTLAEALAAELPDAYADITAEALSALLRDAGVPSSQVKIEGRNARGVRRDHVQTALARREIGSGTPDTGSGHAT